MNISKMIAYSFLYASLGSSIISMCAVEEQHIVIVSAGYNNARYYGRYLESIKAQAAHYDNFHVIHVDDGSPDGSFDLVKAAVFEAGLEDHFILIENENRKGSPLANQYPAIHMCQPEDIIIILDGDDWFSRDDVLAYINNVYTTHDVWLTYGQFQEYPSGYRGFCSPMPHHIVVQNAFRTHPHIPSHLRTFKAGLFHRILKEDIMYGGDFFKMSGDMAAMFPMIEMARDHYLFIPEVLLTYNAENSLNEHKVNKGLQRQVDLEVRRRHRYSPISSLYQ